MLNCPKGKPARNGRDHVGRFEQRGHNGKVRHTNRGAADQINLFVFKFEQSSLYPDPTRDSLFVEKAVSCVLLRPSQLYNHVRKFEESFFGQLALSQRMSNAYDKRFLLLKKGPATHAPRQRPKPADRQIDLLLLKLAYKIEPTQRKYSEVKIRCALSQPFNKLR